MVLPQPHAHRSAHTTMIISEILDSQQIAEATLTARDIMAAADPDDLDIIAWYGEFVLKNIAPTQLEEREFIEAFTRCIPNRTGITLTGMTQDQVTAFENLVARFIYRGKEALK